ncbi:MAG: sigma-70 family RNA polymerase sigma factor [Verrucomicrobia bacterium]|nr:sigma-70 family RNA polymerase sigma factor [Verrucomicrobiota bacterium]
MQADDMNLVREFATGHSERAFTTLVERHVNLVYSVALRRIGSSHDAEEVTQAVFLILAAKAGDLRSGTILSGWLYQAAQLTSANFQRAALRRQRREQEAHMQFTQESEPDVSWQRMAPLLEEAMARLGQDERDAVVLRFFENRTVREVAAALGLREAAAQKRINRATERLRSFFVRRGVKVSSAALLALVASNAVQAAPAQLAASISAAAVLKGAAATASTTALIQTTLKIMTMTKLKISIAAIIVTLGVGTITVTFLNQRQHPSRGESTSSRATTQANNARAAASLTFAGYASPEATIESQYWAMSKGDLKSFLAGLTPDSQRQTEQMWSRLFQSGQVALGGFQILDKEAVSDNEVVLTVKPEKVNPVQLQYLVVQKIGAEWKFAGMKRN